MNRTTLALIAAFLGILLVAWWFEFRPGRALHTASPSPSALLDFRSEQVQRLAIVRGARRVELSRTDAGWRITVPDLGSADPFRVDQLVSALAHLVPERRVILEDQPLDIYGLNPPVLVVDLALDKEVRRLSVGAPTVDRGGYFARVDQGRTVFILPASLVDQQLVPALEHPPTAAAVPSASSPPVPTRSP